MKEFYITKDIPMKTTELIATLQLLINEHGDMPIYMMTECGCWTSDIEKVFIDEKKQIVLYSD